MEETIDVKLSSNFALSQYQPFRNGLGNLSKVADEISFVDLQKTIPFLQKTPYAGFIEPIIKNFDSTTWVKHYFDDGVSAEGYILIK